MGNVFRNAEYETIWTGKWHLPVSYPEGESSIPGFMYREIQRTPVSNPAESGILVDDAVTDQAVTYLEKQHNRPFLLVVSLTNPHDICHWVLGRHMELFAGFDECENLPPLPDNFHRDPEEPEFVSVWRNSSHYGQGTINQWTGTWDDVKWHRYLSVYYRMTEHVDRNIGKLLRALEGACLEEDTLILFTSDHGDGAAHQWVSSLSLNEEVVKVPLVVCWKGRTPSGILDSTHLASGIDVLPTLCDYAGMGIPDTCSGQSLKAVIENPDLPGALFVVTELQPDPERKDLKGRMVHTQRYKYIAFSEGRNPESFFDVVNDPGEKNDLARSHLVDSELARHRTILKDWVDRTHDTFEFPA